MEKINAAYVSSLVTFEAYQLTSQTEIPILKCFIMYYKVIRNAIFVSDRLSKRLGFGHKL